MPDHEPPGIIAPHIPADAYRHAQATGHPVVIVVHTTTPAPGRPLRHYLIPLALAGAGAIGCWGMVAMFMALLDFGTHLAADIAQTAGPVGVGGITLKLTRDKT